MLASGVVKSGCFELLNEINRPHEGLAKRIKRFNLHRCKCKYEVRNYWNSISNRVRTIGSRRRSVWQKR